MKCIVCEKKEAKLWFNLLNVCQDCYAKLMERKKQKESLKDTLEKKFTLLQPSPEEIKENEK